MDFNVNNREELLKTYNGKYLLISHGKILSAYDTFVESANAAKQQGLAITDYIIFPCVPESPLGNLVDKAS